MKDNFHPSEHNNKKPSFQEIKLQNEANNSRGIVIVPKRLQLLFDERLGTDMTKHLYRYDFNRKNTKYYWRIEDDVVDKEIALRAQKILNSLRKEEKTKQECIRCHGTGFGNEQFGEYGAYSCGLCRGTGRIW